MNRLPRIIVAASLLLAAVPGCRRELWYDYGGIAQAVAQPDWKRSGGTPRGCETFVYRGDRLYTTVLSKDISHVEVLLPEGEYTFLTFTYSESEYGTLRFTGKDRLSTIGVRSADVSSTKYSDIAPEPEWIGAGISAPFSVSAQDVSGSLVPYRDWSRRSSAGEAYDWIPVTVYEHPYTGDANTYTYVVLHGELTGVGHDSYYKLDLVRPLPSGANEYLDILRGIRYTMTISSMGSSGYRTEAEAVAHPAGNNVSGSVDTESLDNISDGRGQFFISTTDIVIVDDDALTFQYKFIPDVVGAPTVTANGRVSVEAPAGAVLASAASVASSDAAGGWRTVTLRPNTPEGIVYSQTIRLTTDTGLTKTIRLRLRPRYNMTVSVSPGSVDQEIGASLTATVTLPEGLPESIFPLKMVVSSDKGTVYPDSDVESMPVYVETGSFGYLKEISYSQYTANRTFTCALLTNKVKSAATVTVSNKYFNTGTAAFMNNPRYVTEFTIPAKSMIVTGLSTSWSRSYNSFQLYYDSARNSRIGNSTYNLYAYGPENNTTITVNRMLSTGMIYFYNTTRRTTVGISIEDLEAGGATLKTY